ncbi:hypothetical protein QBC38DRAFT_448507 [Podospora fimiseda]|uniref:Uncharacterized protein n=1 Tax=Podospora fimiseda TaxID=252190 RepID=A0AAN6YSN2_9PEZI|nr:hypothetical protein QBC38DRAFT_448507 [Podospora fimiseda]
MDINGSDVASTDLICYGELCDGNALWFKGVAIDHVASTPNPNSSFLAFPVMLNDGNFFLNSSSGTGSLGSTLTVAQNVHIVEPQWNPSVEDQAIARALRMGQTNEFTIFRYMMKNTVQQQRKKKLARFTFDAAGEDNVNGKLEYLKFTLDGIYE